MLMELRVENLGIIAELQRDARRGTHRDHRRDRRGQDADRRRARPARRRARRSAARARRRGRGARRGPVRGRRRRGRARARRPGGRARRAATSTDGSRRRPSSPSADAGSSTCTVSTRTSRCSRRPSSARSLDRFVGAQGPRPRSRAAHGAATRRAGSTDELAALGGDERARAREVDLLRYEVDEIDAAGIADGDEDDRLLAGRGAPRRRGSAPRGALEPRTQQLEGAGEDALGAAIAALDGRGAVRRVARPAARAAGRAARGRARRADAPRSRSSPIRNACRRCRRAARCSRELVRKYGPTLADVVDYASETRHPARRARATRRAGRGASRRPGAEARDRDGAGREGAVEAARAPAAPRLAGAVDASTSASSRCRPRRSASTSSRPTDPQAIGDDGADEVTFLLAPNPGEPARPLAKAASGGELSRAMLALRVVLSEAPPTLVFDEVDAGIGGEAGRRGRARARDLGRPAPGAVRDPPRAGRGVRRRAGRWSQGRGARAHGRAARRCCSTTRASTRSRACSPGSASPRTHAATRASSSSSRASCASLPRGNGAA